MANNRIEVTLGVNADTSQAKRQLKDLYNTLENLATNRGQINMAGDLRAAQAEATKLQAILSTSTNANGVLDLSKFSQSLKQGGLTLESLRLKMQDMGPTGRQAFLQLTQSIQSAQMPMKKTNKILDEFVLNLKKTAGWQISSSIIHGFMGALQSAVGYAEDLNKNLNDIRIVSGQSAAQMEKFAITANKAAKALSTTTNEYVKASLIYYQQGLGTEEIEERTKATIKMANVTRQAAQTVSDQLTAIWNNFDDGTKSLEYYADAITALGAATASSTDEIAAGLEKFAAVTSTIGLSYEYATAALATVTSETRASADTVGTAFKTLFSRIQGLSLGETLEDGTTLNKYSEALDTIGVNIKTSTGDIKDMNTILDEMGAKWGSLAKDEQLAVAQTVAGIRQYNQLIALMDNWDTFKINLEIAETSEGTLDAQQEVFEDSWKAASNRVRASLESIFNQLIDDDFFIDILNGFAKILDVVEKFIDALGGVKGVLISISSIVGALFAKHIGKGISNFMNNNVFAIASQRKQAEKVRNQAVVESQKVASDKGTQGGTIESGIYKEAGEYQEKYYQKEKQLTELSKAQAEIEKQRLETLRNTAIAAAQQASEAETDELGRGNRAKLRVANSNDQAAFDEGLEQLKNYGRVMGISQSSGASMGNTIDALISGKTAEQQRQSIQQLSAQYATMKKTITDLGLTIETAFGPDAAEALNKFKQELDKAESEIKNLEAQAKAAGKTFGEMGYTPDQIIKTESMRILDEGVAGILDGEDYARTRANNLIQYGSAGATAPDPEGKTKGLVQMIQGQDVGVLERYTLASQRTGAALVQAETEQQNFNNAVKQGKENLDGMPKKSADFGTSVTMTTSAISALSSAYMAFQSLGSIWKNEDTTFGDKVGQSLMVVAGVLPVVTSLMTTFAAATWATVWPMLLLVAALGTLALAIYKIIEGIKIANSYKLKAKIEEVSKAITELNGKISDTKKSVDELYSSFEKFDELQTKIRGLVTGTEEWNKAIKENNELVLSLIEKYPRLTEMVNAAGERAVTFENGSYQIAEWAQEQLKQQEEYNLALLQKSKIGLQTIQNDLEEEQANNELKEKTISASKNGKDYIFNAKDIYQALLASNSKETITTESKQLIENFLSTYSDVSAAEIDKINEAVQDYIKTENKLENEMEKLRISTLANTNAILEKNEDYKNLKDLEVKDAILHIANANSSENIEFQTGLQYNSLFATGDVKHYYNDFIEKYGDYLSDEYKNLEIEKITGTGAELKIVSAEKDENGKNIEYSINDIAGIFGAALASAQEEIDNEKIIDIGLRIGKSDIKESGLSLLQGNGLGNMSVENFKQMDQTFGNGESYYDKLLELFEWDEDLLLTALGATSKEDFINNIKTQLEDIDKIKNYSDSYKVSEAQSMNKLALKESKDGIVVGQQYAEQVYKLGPEILNKVLEFDWDEISIQEVNKKIKELFLDQLEKDTTKTIENVNSILATLGKGEELSEGQNNLINELETEFPLLAQIADRTSDVFQTALEQIIQAKEEINTQIQIDKADLLRDELDFSLDNQFEILPQIDDSDFQKKLEEIMEADYSIEVSVQADIDSDISKLEDQINGIQEAFEGFDDDGFLSPDNAIALAEAIPGILENAQILSDGRIKLDDKMRESSIELAKTDVEANTEAAIAKLKIQLNYYQAMATIYGELADDLSEANLDDIKRKQITTKALEKIEIENQKWKNQVDDDNVEKQIADNKNIVDKGSEAAQTTSTNWANAFKSVAENSYKAAEIAINNLEAIASGDIQSLKQDVTDINGKIETESITTDVNTPNAIVEDDIDAFDTNISLENQKTGAELIRDQYNEKIEDTENQILMLEAIPKEFSTKLEESLKKGKDKDSGDLGQKEISDEEVERYKLISYYIEKSARNVEKLNKELDKAYGADRVKAYNKINQELTNNIALLEKRLEQEDKYFEEDKKRVQELSATIGGQTINMGFEVNEEGVVVNEREIREQWNNKLAEAYKYYNSLGSKEEQEAYEEQVIKPTEDAIEKSDKAIELMETTRDKRFDTAEAIADQQAELLQNQLSALDYKLELRLELNKEEYEKIDRQIEALGEGFYQSSERALKTIEKINPLNDDMASIKQQKENLDKLYKEGKLNDSQYREALEKLRDRAKDVVSSSKEIEQALRDAWSGAFEKGTQEIQKVIKEWENLNAQVEHYQNLLGLMGQEKNYKLQNLILDTQMKMAKDSFKANQESLKFYEDQQKQAEDNLKTYNEEVAKGIRERDYLTEESLQKNVETAKNAVNETQQAVYKSTEEYFQHAKDKLENLGKIAAEELSDALAGDNYSDLESLENVFSRITGLSEGFLTKTNQLYETNKLISQAQLKIDQTSNNITKQKYNQYIKYVKELGEASEISEFDLNVAKERFEILQAQIALEEAQNAKSQVRLTRDAEGNWGYTYTTDSKQVAEAEQKLADAENKLYNTSLKSSQDFNNKAFQIRKEFASKADDLRTKRNSGELSEDEYQKELDALTQYSREKYNKISQEYYDAIGVLRETSLAFEDYLFTDIISIEEFSEAQEKYISKDKENWIEYGNVVKEMSEEIGFNLEDLGKDLGGVSDKSSRLVNIIAYGENGKQSLIKSIGDELKEVELLTIAFGENAEAVNEIETEANEFITLVNDDLKPLIEELNNTDIQVDFTADTSEFDTAMASAKSTAQETAEAIKDIFDNVKITIPVNYQTSGGSDIIPDEEALDFEPPPHIGSKLVTPTRYFDGGYYEAKDKDGKVGYYQMSDNQTLGDLGFQFDFESQSYIPTKNMPEIWSGKTAPITAVNPEDLKYYKNFTNMGIINSAGQYLVKFNEQTGLEKNEELIKEEERTKKAANSGKITYDKYFTIGGQKFIVKISKTGNEMVYPLTGGNKLLDETSAWINNFDSKIKSDNLTKFLFENITYEKMFNILDKGQYIKSFDDYYKFAHIKSGFNNNSIISLSTKGSPPEFAKLEYPITVVYENIADSDDTKEFKKSTLTKKEFLQLFGYNSLKSLYKEYGENLKYLNVPTYDTGGRTPSWSSNEGLPWAKNGKFAILHQNERILNAQDTIDFDKTVEIIKRIGDYLDKNALGLSLGLLSYGHIDTPNISDQTLQQDITIHAEFPNAVDHNEIEMAFQNLENIATQYASKTK